MKTRAVTFVKIGLPTLFAMLACTSTSAHHSFNFLFDANRWIAIEGVVTAVHFQNPHVALEVEVTNEDGATQNWAVETNHRAGLEPEVSVGDAWFPDTIQPGDTVIAEGHPSKREGRAALHAITIQRPSDGWRWAWRLNALPENRQGEFQSR